MGGVGYRDRILKGQAQGRTSRHCRCPVRRNSDKGGSTEETKKQKNKQNPRMLEMIAELVMADREVGSEGLRFQSGISS